MTSLSIHDIKSITIIKEEVMNKCISETYVNKIIIESENERYSIICFSNKGIKIAEMEKEEY